MAAITKSRARKTLAASKPSFGWSNTTPIAGFPESGEKFNIVVDDANSKSERATYYRCHLSREEAINFVDYVAGHITLPAQTWLDKRPIWERLRALANRLESEANNEA